MTTSPGSASRLLAVDALRGAIVILMTLDHVRDFFHIGAMSFQPEDLTQTTAGLFLTRCRWFAGVKSRRKDWWLSYV